MLDHLPLAPLALTLAALAAAAAPARADGGLSISFGKSSRHSGVAVQAWAGGPRGGLAIGYERHRGQGHGHGGVIRSVPQRVWVPGHHELVQRRTWVPGRSRQVWVQPVLETRYDWCGRPFTVQVVPGHWSVVHEPGHYELRQVEVWREGRWQGAHW